MPECQKAFDTIIEKLTTAPVLGFADPQLPYTLHTDTSTLGLGAALYQEQDSEMWAIAYASRGLSSSEKDTPPISLSSLLLSGRSLKDFMTTYVETNSMS